MSAEASAGMTFVLLEPWRPVSEMVFRRMAFQYTSLRIHCRACGFSSAAVTFESQARRSPA